MIVFYPWSAHYPKYRQIMLGENARHLKKGVNTLTVYGMVGYEQNKDGEYSPVGQMDITIEGLKKEDVQ